MGCAFIKYHHETTPCPQSNIDMARTILMKKPPSFNASRNTSNTFNQSSANSVAAPFPDNSYNSRNQSNSFGTQHGGAKNIPPLPRDFDNDTQCKNCFWSGQDNGQFSGQRRQEWHQHATRDCTWGENKRRFYSQGNKSDRPSYNANSTSFTPHTSPPASVITVQSRSSRNDNRDRSPPDRSRSRDSERSSRDKGGYTNDRYNRYEGDRGDRDRPSRRDRGYWCLHDDPSLTTMLSASALITSDTVMLDSGANHIFFPSYHLNYMSKFIPNTNNDRVTVANGQTLAITGSALLGPFHILIAPGLHKPLISESYLTTHFDIIIVRYDETTWLIDACKKL